MPTHTGGCLCGQVRYSISADPIAVRACWCRVCQYLAAGSATINAVFRADAVSVTGRISDYASKADSGEAMHRQFCPDCGTGVFSDAESRSHVRIVRVGTLDNAADFAPSAIIWTKSAPDWAYLHPDMPQLEGQPPPQPKP